MEINDDFINISYHKNNLDLYYHRTSIFKAIKKNLPNLKGKLLDTGCGKMPYRDYILTNSDVTNYVGLDIENAISYSESVKPDVTWDGKKMPFEDNSFDCAFATEVLEHVPEPAVFLSEVFRVLKQKGMFFFTTPFLWPLHEVPHDEYRYTPFAIERLLKQEGFVDTNINALGGWNASMAQMLGLWIKRSSISRRKKKIIQLLAKPIISYLISHDDAQVNFMERPMITGISGVAFKPSSND